MAEQERIGRRGLVAAAAALVAGIATTKGAQSVAALTTDTEFRSEGTLGANGIGFAGYGSANVAFGTYDGLGVYTYGVKVTGTTTGVQGTGVATGVQGNGTGSGTGVQGNSASGFGVFGYSSGSGGNGNSAGVYGLNAVNSANAIGVQGAITGSAGIGVLGGSIGGATAFNGTGVQGLSDGGNGVYGKSSATGVRGETTNGTGVQGVTTGGTGVQGVTTGGYGVSGQSTGSGFGVYGESTANHAIVGQLIANAVGKAAVFGGANGTGTYGVIGISSSGIAGVLGKSSGGGAGVQGTNTTGIGVYGISGGGSAPFGVVGSVTSAPGFALYGVVNVAGAVGFAAGAGVAGAIAGQFAGPVNIYNNGSVAPGNLYIAGNYTASGTKSQRYRTPTVRTACCTAWNPPKRGSRTSAQERSPAGKAGGEAGCRFRCRGGHEQTACLSVCPR